MFPTRKFLSQLFVLMLAIVWEAFFSPLLWGVESSLPQPKSSLSAASEAEAEAEASRFQYVLQAGDHIKVKIFPEDEYIRGGETEISAEGNITLPVMGKVKVMGLTAIEAEKMIAKVLEMDYLVDPEVAVEIITRQAYQYSLLVLGQVKKPGSIEFPTDTRRLTLLQAISLAGGFTEIANIKKIRIVRKVNEKNEIIKANAEDILSGKDPDIEVEPGDTVNVAESVF